MNTVLDTVNAREDFLVYQPHRLQLSGGVCAAEVLLRPEAIGDGQSIPFVPAGETIQFDVLEVIELT